MAYARDLDAIMGLARVLEWCEERSVKVSFAAVPDGEFDPNLMSIKICGRSTPESQLFWLLHECGHFLIAKHDKRVNRGKAHRVDARSLIAKVEVLAEEIEAWNRGQSLAKRLRIFIDRSRFNTFKATAVNTYMLWR